MDVCTISFFCELELRILWVVLRLQLNLFLSLRMDDIIRQYNILYIILQSDRGINNISHTLMENKFYEQPVQLISSLLPITIYFTEHSYQCLSLKRVQKQLKLNKYLVIQIEIQMCYLRVSVSFQYIFYYITDNRKFDMLSLYPFVKKSQQQMPNNKGKEMKSNFHKLQQLKSAQMINTKLIVSKKQTFPQIQSPFLKKTVNNLFSCQINTESVYAKRGSNNVKVSKSPPSNDYQNRMSGIQKICREECISEGDELYRFQRRIGKSFSQNKQPLMHFQDMTPEKLLALRKSEKKIFKTPTEGSVTTTTTTSKEIYQKLNNLNEKNKLSSVQSSLRLNNSNNLKQYKLSNFVLKYKLATSLHQQKIQLRTLKNSAQDIKQHILRQNIKIKNYTKFTDIDDIQN